MRQYIDMTPTWQGILPMWKRIIHRSCKLINTPARPSRGQSPVDGDGNFARFWIEMERMAIAADRWSEYCKAVDEVAGVVEMERVNEGLRP